MNKDGCTNHNTKALGKGSVNTWLPGTHVRQHNNSNEAHEPLCLWQWYATGPLQAHSQELFVGCIWHGHMNGVHH